MIKLYKKSLTILFTAFFSILLGYGIMYARVGLIASSGDQLTSAKWNELVNKVAGIYTDGSNSVGIGSTIPVTKMHIVSPYSTDTSGGTSNSDSMWGVYKRNMTLYLDTGGTRTLNRGGGIGFGNSDGFVLGAIKGASTNSTAGQYGGYLGFYTTGANSGGGSNGYERMRIDEGGRVTKPDQPFFEVKICGTTINAGSIIKWDTITNNRGSSYNTTTGLFTAPVSGVYVFGFNTLTQNANSGEYRFGFWKNTGYYNTIIVQKNANQWLTSQGTTTTYLNAGDTFGIGYITGGGSIHLDCNYNSFWGYLLG